MATRVFRYGLLPPTLGESLVREQIRGGHRYYNQLVELERRRRSSVRAVLGSHGDIEPLVAESDRLQVEIDRRLAEVKQARQSARTRSGVTVDTTTTAELASLRTQARTIRAVLREAKAALRGDPDVTATIAGINAEVAEAQRQARAACGVYWGTYLLAEQAIDQARKSATVEPAFRRWTGEGAVAVQIQGGLDLAGLMSETDTRVQITSRAIPVPGRGGKPRQRLRLRVSSDGREPIWAEWPVILHRPLPAGAVIKWAKVTLQRHGPREEWTLHLTLSLPEEWQSEACGSGAVALNLGWRKTDDGLRVGYWLDEHGGHDEVVISSSAVGDRLDKAEDIRSIRDQNLDLLRSSLVAWLRGHHDPPEWLQERTATLHAWRSAARFAALAIAWRGQRFDGDSEAFDRLEEWRKRDRHLWLYETGVRRGATLHRRELYRVLAATLARRYGTLVLGAFDLRQVARLAPVEAASETAPPPVRNQRVEAAVSELRAALVNAFRSRGGVVIEVASMQATRACASCGHVETAWDPATGIWHQCSSCGARWDQDANHCANLLARWREGSGEEKRPATARGSRFSRLRRAASADQPVPAV